MKIRGYRYVSYSRTLGVSYSREFLGGQWHHDLTFSLWRFCVFVIVVRNP